MSRRFASFHSIFLLYFVISALFSPFVDFAWTKEVTIAWDPNGEPDLLGYNVYVGEQPGQYSSPMNAQNNTTYTVPNLPDNKTHYIAVTAYDTSGNESIPSQEVVSPPATADTTPPTVTLTTPVNGATVSGIVTVSATAADNAGVIGVQFRVNDVNVGAEDSTNPYSVNWDTTGLAAGDYILTATARDAAGNTTTSPPVTVHVAEPPAGTGFLQDSGPDGLLVMEAEHFHGNTPQGNHVWTLVTSPDYSADGAMQATPNNGTNHDTGYVTTSPRMDFQVIFMKTGLHHVWVRGLGATGGDNSVHLGLDGQALATSDRLQTAKGSFNWFNTTRDNAIATIDVPAPGSHTVNVWMREDGFILDKLLLTTNPEYKPTGSGPAESPQGDDAPPAGDTEAPSQPSNLSVQAVSSTHVHLTWTASSDNVGVMGYNVSRNGVLVVTTTNTAYDDTGLAPATAYLYAVTALDAAGNESSAANGSATTPALPDTTAPSVSITTPASGTVVSGVVTVAATALDDTGIVGVQFRVNDVNVGAEDSTNPYSVNWDTTGLAAGDYILTATARDAAGNTTTSPPVTVHVAEPPAGTGFLQDSGPDGLLVMEAEHFHGNTPQGNHVWTLVTSPDYSAGGAMQATPNTGANYNTNYVIKSPQMDFQVNFTKTGLHYIWCRGLGASGKDDSMHVGLDGQPVATSDRISGFKKSLGWSQSTMDKVVATINVTSLGQHTLNVWMREDGFILDKLLLTTNPEYKPTGSGPAESPQGDDAPPAGDTEAPSQPSNLSVQAVSSTHVHLTWTASSDNVGVMGYNVSRNGVLVVTTTNTAYDDTGLAPATAYLYAVTALDAAGNESPAATASATTLSLPDTTPPTVALTSPMNGAIVSGTVTLIATAADDVGVVGVQFQINGVNHGTEDTTNAYAVKWDTMGLPPGNYALTAIARDAAGNTTTSTPVAVTIEEPTSNTPLLISNFATASPAYSYEVVENGLQPGAMAWVDRTYSYSNVPSSLQGTTYIKTATGDKKSKNNDSWITFTVNQSVTVYVAHDPSINPKPTWLNGYTLTSDSLGTNNGTTLQLYSKTFPAGSVNLGANWGGGSQGNMYTVVIVAQGGSSGPPADTTPPSQPGSFTATGVSSSQINLNWTASTDNVGIKDYQITRNGTLIATTAATSFSDSGLAPNTNYTYTVKAVDQANNASTAASASATTQPDAPPPGTASATLSWNKNTEPDLAGYRTYMGTSSHNYTTVQDVGLTGTPDNPNSVVNNLTTGQMYYFAVTAYDTSGNESALSPEVPKMVQ